MPVYITYIDIIKIEIVSSHGPVPLKFFILKIHYATPSPVCSVPLFHVCSELSQPLQRAYTHPEEGGGGAHLSSTGVKLAGQRFDRV